ncbi:MAG: hypothetical protein ABW164_03810 [Sphingobium sp.]
MAKRRDLGQLAALLHAVGLRYARVMASEQMIEAIGNLQWAVARLEEAASSLPAPVAAAIEAPSQPELDREAAREALRSLDALIGEIKGRGQPEVTNG